MEMLLLVLVAPVLLVAAYFDLRYMRIPNLLSITLLAAFAIAVFVLPPDEVVLRIAAASVVFMVGLGAFAFNILGGGDVKLLSALVLFVPSESLLMFANVFSLSLAAGIALIVALKHLPVLGRAGWRSLSEGDHFPMGISIALAGIALPLISLVFSAA